MEYDLDGSVMSSKHRVFAVACGICSLFFPDKWVSKSHFVRTIFFAISMGSIRGAIVSKADRQYQTIIIVMTILYLPIVDTLNKGQNGWPIVNQDFVWRVFCIGVRG